MDTKCKERLAKALVDYCNHIGKEGPRRCDECKFWTRRMYSVGICEMRGGMDDIDHDYEQPTMSCQEAHYCKLWEKKRGTR